jgi:tripeptidyl-peptidase-1
MVDNNLAGFYSGAGASQIFSTPSFQSSQVSAYKSKIPSSASGEYNANGRFFPDLAAQGSRYVIVQKGQTGLVGGTSASCPLVASLLTLQNARRRANGQDSIGWANPALYSKSNLKDITSGGSYGCGSSTTNGFPAASGWDGSSGLGSPSYSALTAVF